MKLRGPPLWLVCDVFCWLGLLMSFISFTVNLAAAVQRMIAQGRRSFERDELASLARLQAEQEAWLSYAIARRAFKLAGVRARARFPHITPARSLRALKHRASQILREHLNIDRITRRRAQHLKRLMATRAVSLPRAGEAQRALAEQHANSGGGPASPCATAPEPTAPPAPHQTAHASASAPASLPRSGEEGGVLPISSFRPTARRRAGLRVRAPPWRALTIAKTNNPRLADPSARSRAFACHAEAERRRRMRIVQIRCASRSSGSRSQPADPVCASWRRR